MQVSSLCWRYRPFRFLRFVISSGSIFSLLWLLIDKTNAEQFGDNTINIYKGIFANQLPGLIKKNEVSLLILSTYKLYILKAHTH